MKAIILTLFFFTNILHAGDKTNLLETKVSLNVTDTTLEKTFEIITANTDGLQNIVFKGDAGKNTLPSLRVKGVTLVNLLEVVESVAEVNIEIIDHTNQAADPEPFTNNAPSKILTSAGILVISNREPARKPNKKDRLAPPAPAVVEKRLTPPQPAVIRRSGTQLKPARIVEIPKSAKNLQTEVVSIRGLGVNKELLIDAIQFAWKMNEHNGELVFHEPSKLIIIKGDSAALDSAMKVFFALKGAPRKL